LGEGWAGVGDLNLVVGDEDDFLDLGSSSGGGCWGGEEAKGEFGGFVSVLVQVLGFGLGLGGGGC